MLGGRAWVSVKEVLVVFACASASHETKGYMLHETMGYYSTRRRSSKPAPRNGSDALQPSAAALPVKDARAEASLLLLLLLLPPLQLQPLQPLQLSWTIFVL